jgi:hypothetical protein
MTQGRTAHGDTKQDSYHTKTLSQQQQTQALVFLQKNLSVRGRKEASDRVKKAQRAQAVTRMKTRQEHSKKSRWPSSENQSLIVEIPTDS